eukprot:GEMP01006828.1.p1 GENE.GEMP01006828.1~~GEMP01006828.1.p1  ORF type:complete len:688 (+),score=92.06 GEMP01006828.1:323-2386(+)
MLFVPLLAAIHCAATECGALSVVACRRAVKNGDCESAGFGKCKPKGESQEAKNVVNAQSQCLHELGSELNDGYIHPVNPPALPGVRDGPVRSLRMSDWPTGDDKALRIKTPGKYRLEEDILFDFKETAVNQKSPLHWDNVIGISIEVSGVELDLNGHTMSMSPRFMSRQRFWNHIQLNNFVFRPTQGLYKGNIVTPSDIIIRNGKLGQTSHMGIQGIENGRVAFEDLTFESFEVAAISCKDCHDVTIRRCTIDNTNLEVPFGILFAELWMMARWVFKSQDAIKASSLMRRAWTDFNRPELFDAFLGKSSLFAAKDGLPQGSIFGIQLKTTGRQSEITSSERAIIDTVTIKNVKNGEGTRVGLSFKNKQIFCQNENALDFHGYFDTHGNPKEVNGQSLDVVIFRTCVITGSEEMPEALKNYTSKGSTKNIFDVPMDARGTRLKKFFGSDIRGHEPAGAFGIRIKGWKHVLMQNINIDGVTNGETGSIFGDKTHAVMLRQESFSDFPAVWQGPKASQSLFKLANAYGVALDNVANSFLNKVDVKNVKSKVGMAFGVAVGGKSSVTWLDKVSVTGISVKDPNVEKDLPFLKQKAMPLFIEEETTSIATGLVGPVSACCNKFGTGRRGGGWGEVVPNVMHYAAISTGRKREHWTAGIWVCSNDSRLRIQVGRNDSKGRRFLRQKSMEYRRR